MTCKVVVQKNIFSDSLALVGRAASNHSTLPVLSNVLLSKDEGQLRLSATNLTIGVTVWMDASLDGDPGLTLPAKTLADVINTLAEPEVTFSVNGKAEASLKSGRYKGTIKGIDATEFPSIPDYPANGGVSLDAGAFKEMLQAAVFAASPDDTRPILTGVLVSMDDKELSIVATDGFRLAIGKMGLPEPASKKQMIIPASSMKEVVRILNATKAARVSLAVPPSRNQVVIRCENVQIVSQLIEGRFPDYQAILPESHKTRTIVNTSDLLKACKQAGIIAREGSNVVRFHLQPGESEQIGKVKLLAESAETGASEIELEATVEGQELEIGFNVKYLQDGLEPISAKNVIIETNANNTPAVIRSAGEEDYLYVLMPMHIEG